MAEELVRMENVSKYYGRVRALDGVTFDHLASVYESYTGKIAVENLRPRIQYPEPRR